jgi:hypothetical protein
MPPNPILPNSGNRQTLGSRRIDLHYGKLGIPRRWTWARFDALCAFLRVTHEEMASTICMPHSTLPTAYKRNCFPGPAALLLTLIEANVKKGLSEDIIENPIASLPSNG